MDREHGPGRMPPAAEQACRLARPDGALIAYRVRRPGGEASAAAAAPLLLLHGLASNLTRYDEFVEHTALAARHALLRVDLRGHGGSLTRRRVDSARWCDDLAALLQAEAARPAIVVGHSLGAQVALQFAQRHPQHVRALVLIDPVFRAALHGRWRWLARASPLIALAAAAARALAAIGLHRGVLPPLDLRALDAMARQALRSPQAEAEFVRRYSSARADLRHVPTSVYLQDLVEMFRPAPQPRTLGVPVLALLSSGATFADASAMRALLAGPQVRLQGIECQHWPLTERPREVREAIERWVQALTDA